MFPLQSSIKVSSELPLFTILLIAVTVIVSILAFQRKELFRKLLFEVEPILSYNEWWRMASSGLLHGGWAHLIMNMLVLWFFGGYVEARLGHFPFLGIYVVSLVVSSALSLFIHRNHADYSAVGASGAVAGIIYTFIMLEPTGSLRLFFFLPVPNWVFAIGYIAYSLYGIRANRDNIGHEAHLGGALCGAIIGVAINPAVLQTHWWMVALMTLPVIVFYFLFLRNPAILGIKGHYRERAKSTFKGRMKVVKRPGEGKVDAQQELNGLLDKINSVGYERLTRKEKQRLEELSEGGPKSDS